MSLPSTDHLVHHQFHRDLIRLRFLQIQQESGQSLKSFKSYNIQIQALQEAFTSKGASWVRTADWVTAVLEC